MGCLPSREFHESPQSLQYIRTDSLVFIRLPLTPHFFPTPQSLAFQQLFACRAAQSAKYGFDILDPHRKCCGHAEITIIKEKEKEISGIFTQDSQKSYCKRCDKEKEFNLKTNRDCHNNKYDDDDEEEEDWDGVCEEELEMNPSAIYREKKDYLIPTSNEHDNSTVYLTDDGIEKEENKHNEEHIHHCYCRSPEELYRVLITQGTVPAITETNAEMRALYDKELAWRSAREIIRNYRQQQQQQQEQEEEEQNEEKKKNKRETDIPAAVRAAEKVLPPQRFLWPLPTAVLNVLTPTDNTYQTPPDDIIRNTLPCDGKLHLMEYNSTLFLVACSNTEVDTYIVSPIAVRVVGCDSLIPAVCRGTPWLRKLNATPNIINYNDYNDYNNSDDNNNDDDVDLEEDRYNEELPPFQRPPVLCACLFCGVDVCCKAISRAQLAGYGHYALHSKMTGMSGLIVRPVWHLGIASNVPLLRLTAELRGLLQGVNFSTYSSVVTSIRGKRILLRFQEKAVMAVCEVCARSDNFAKELHCHHMQQQQQQGQKEEEKEEKLMETSIFYDYGGRIGVHSKTGELCVTTHIRNSLHMLEDASFNEEKEEKEEMGERKLRGKRVGKENGKRKTCCCKTELVFVVTIPWKTAKGPSSQRTITPTVAATEDEKRKKVKYSFSDGDLIVYNRTREEWELLPPSLVQLEHVLLFWVRKTLDKNVFSRSDSGWLRRRQPNQQIVEEGRFHIWSFIHDGVPYFFGIMPKFAKERRKRELSLLRKTQLERKQIEQEPQQQDNTDNTQSLQQEHSPKRTMGQTKRYGDAANYFRNGCFMWNPYGRQR
ncbi:uncharacterized protein TM35_000281820 [Trypanosoma theileri]|uniref:Uncharacterized protein n=1 Tax=Trypanosoma theileri TaxID=67003 RepID=A0A1X0NP26_9TRYP|nr:uncharacterized protein TM35_000281820 [Trypanosoma theileri]ORC86466.1 hypothetical protein TM35_000281820 [Trypanosoma theileri]